MIKKNLKFQSLIYKKAFWISCFLFSLVIISFSYILAIMPNCCDELIFEKTNNESGYKETLSYLFYNDNSRLANIVVIFLLYLPRFVSVSLEIAAFTLGIYLITVLGEIKTTQWRRLSLLLFLIVITPMWYQSIFTFDYAYNYIVPMPLLFGLIYLYNKKIDKRPFWLILLLGFILGAWHESYALTFLSGAFLCGVFNLKSITKKQILIFLAVLIGFLWIFFNPGTWARVNTYTNINLKNLGKLAYIWPYFLFLILWIITLRAKKNRQIAQKPIFIFTLGSGICFPFITIFGREIAGMPSILLSSCSLSIIIPLLFSNVSSFLKTLSAVILSAIMSVHLIGVCIEANKISHIYNKINQFLDTTDSNQNYIFGPTYYSYQAPLITLREPFWRIFDPGSGTIKFMQRAKDKNENLIIVPEVLMNYEFEKEGKETKTPNVKIWNNFIVSSNPQDTIYKNARVTYSLINKDFKAPLSSTIFETTKGKEYVFIYPERNILTRYLGEPTDIIFE